MIHLKNITKKFGKREVINSISLEIDKGVIFGLLGPNGAGKTTLIRMLCGLLSIDKGEISINHKSIEEAKKEFGYVAQYFGQYEELSVWENVLFYAGLYGVTDQLTITKLLKRYDLEKYKETKAKELSGGYKRRLALVCALSHDPKILFLDEPTAGIDPVTRKLLWDDFYQLSQEGKTLFVTTHYMEEAERCKQLAFLAQGEIVAQGTPKSIKNVLGEVHLYTLQLSYTPTLLKELSSLKGILLLNQFGNELRILVDKECDIEVIKALLHSKKIDEQLQKGEPNLEDVFIALTKERAL